MGHSDEARAILDKYLVGDGPEVSRNASLSFHSYGARDVCCQRACRNGKGSIWRGGFSKIRDFASHTLLEKRLLTMSRHSSIPGHRTSSHQDRSSSRWNKHQQLVSFRFRRLKSHREACSKSPRLTLTFYPPSHRSGGFSYLLPLAGIVAYFAYRYVPLSLSPHFVFADSRMGII